MKSQRDYLSFARKKVNTGQWLGWDHTIRNTKCLSVFNKLLLA